jgi:hypothetical protein
MRRFTAEEDAAISRGYRSGLLAVEIAEALGRNKNQIIGRAHRLGVKSSLRGAAGNKRRLAINPPVQPAQPSYLEAIKAWVSAHPFCTHEECAIALGIGKGTVAKHVPRIRMSWMMTLSTPQPNVDEGDGK